MNRRKLLLSTAGSGADVIVRQLVQFLVLLALARLLTPADFGTVALLAVLVAIAGVAADAGITTAVLQSRSLTRLDIDSAFWTSVVLGCALTLIGAALAHPLSAAFGRPDLGGIGVVLAFAVVSSAVGQVPNALMVKEQRFWRLALIGSISAASAGAIAITLAVQGKGVVALAVQLVAYPAIGSVLLLAFTGYRPGMQWSPKSTGRTLRLGRWVLAANLVDSAYLRLQTVLVGSVFGTSSLGRYQRADLTQQLAAEATANVVGRVALPLFAASSDRPDQLRVGLRTTVRSTMAVNAPIMTLMAALSAPLLEAFFGPQWVSAAMILSILCVAGLLWPWHVLAVSLLYAVSHNRVVFRIDLVKKACATVLVLVGALFGLEGIAVAQVLGGLAAVVINSAAVHRALGFHLLDERAEALTPLLVSVPIAGVVAWVSATWSAPPLIEVLVLGSAGAVTYFALCLGLRIVAVTDLVDRAMNRAGEAAHD